MGLLPGQASVTQPGPEVPVTNSRPQPAARPGRTRAGQRGGPRRYAVCGALLLAWAGAMAGARGEEEISPPVPPAADKAAAAEAACHVLFADDDPRLFDFIATRQSVDWTAYAGRRIGTVEYTTLPVFNTQDPDEDRWLYRGANRLHVDTGAATLQRQVLMANGDALDVARIEESERILRANNYLYDAMILPARDCGDTLDLRVVVRDIWTLQPALNFSHTGNQSSSSFGFAEDNLLGTGRSLTLSFDRSPARSSTQLGFTDRHFLDGRTVLQLSHGNSDDGSENNVLLEKPFYAFDTTRAGGVSVHDAARTETTSATGIVTATYDHHEEAAEAWYGIASLPEVDAVGRWRAGVTRMADTYASLAPGSTDPLPADRLFVYPWLEYEHAENRFRTLTNVSRMFRNEDIDIGTGWRLRGGLTNSRLGSEQDGALLQFDWHDTLGSGTHHLLRNRFHADLFIDESNGRRRDSLYGYEARYDLAGTATDRWLASLRLDAGEGLAPEDQLTTGGANGLLGYPDAWQRGDRRAVFGVERRHFLAAHPFNLFRIATAAFAEAGQAWDSAGGIVQSDKVLTDIGVGLRLNSSKARSNNILQFNVAMPLTDTGRTDKLQWSIFAGESF